MARKTFGQPTVLPGIIIHNYFHVNQYIINETKASEHQEALKNFRRSLLAHSNRLDYCASNLHNIEGPYFTFTGVYCLCDSP